MAIADICHLLTIRGNPIDKAADYAQEMNP
jgi:hypothetical protein